MIHQIKNNTGGAKSYGSFTVGAGATVDFWDDVRLIFSDEINGLFGEFNEGSNLLAKDIESNDVEYNIDNLTQTKTNFYNFFNDFKNFYFKNLVIDEKIGGKESASVGDVFQMTLNGVRLLPFSPPSSLPPGGTTGQVLSKIDATDYNTQWITPAEDTTYNLDFYANSDSVRSNFVPLYGLVTVVGTENKSSLLVTSVKYETSDDGGATWTERADFTALSTYLNGSTTISTFIFVRAIFTFDDAFEGEQAINLTYKKE